MIVSVERSIVNKLVKNYPDTIKPVSDDGYKTRKLQSVTGKDEIMDDDFAEKVFKELNSNHPENEIYFMSIEYIPPYNEGDFSSRGGYIVRYKLV